MNRTQRITTIVLALVAASGFAIAGVGAPWWSMPDVSILPMYTAKCFGGACDRVPQDWVGDGSWARFGVAAWGAGLIAAFCLAALAGAIASKRRGNLLAKMVLAAALAATAAGGAFVATFPGVPGMSISFGVYLYFGAVLLAVAAAVITLRGARAAEVPA